MDTVQISFAMSTDTAAIAVFDPACLIHRCHDPADWWSIQEEAVEEVRKGNLLVADLRSDGRYRVHVEAADVIPFVNAITAFIRCKSGILFVGPGEVITGDGRQPDQDCGGRFLKARPGVVLVGMSKSGSDVSICLEATKKDINSTDPMNTTTWESLRLA